MRILETVVAMNRSLAADRPAAGQPLLNEALVTLARCVGHDALVLLIGDGSGVDGDTTAHVTRLSAHNDCLAALVYDPLEAALPDAGRLAATDGDRELLFDSGSARLRARYRAGFEERRAQMETLSRHRAIPLLPISTAEPVQAQLRQLLGTMPQRRSGGR
jgi:hypothetical protein